MNYRSELGRSFLATGAVFALTAFHHMYGAIVYHTPWREHVIVIGGIVLFLSFLCAYLYGRHRRKPLLAIYLVLTFLVFGAGIGIFEGLYNHLVKDILYFSGVPMDTWRRMYPAPAYEIPADFVFEATGILQFLVAIFQIRYLKKVYRLNYQDPGHSCSDGMDGK